VPAGRPDPQRVQAQAAVIFAGAGETATLRTYLSTSAGAARYGAADTFNYRESLITGLFYVHRARPSEGQRPGGQVMDAGLFVATVAPVGARDQLIWRGSAYRADGSPWPEVLGGRTQWHTPIALSNPTG
jgi:hypothetical protein